MRDLQRINDLLRERADVFDSKGMECEEFKSLTRQIEEEKLRGKQGRNGKDKDRQTRVL